jgi:hypothetical protein
MSMNHDMAHHSDLAATYAGRPVLDEHGLPLGSIADIVHDDSGRPEYLVVDPGVFRAAKCVPIRGSYATSFGEIVVGWGRARFRDAPKAGKGNILSSLERDLLEVHYAGA